MLLDELDETATKRKTIKVLRSYQRYKRIANRNILFLQSPAMTGMPRSSSGENTEEIKIVNKVTAETIVKTIEHCIESIVGSDYRMLLENVYIHNDTAYEVQSTLLISEATMYRKLDKALLRFAEVYPLEELLVFC